MVEILKFGQNCHQVAPLAFPNCLGLPYWYDQLELGWHLQQPETHQLSQQNFVSHLETPGPIDRTPGIPGSDKKEPWLPVLIWKTPALLSFGFRNRIRTGTATWLREREEFVPENHPVLVGLSLSRLH